MKTNVGRRQRVMVWLGVACLGLVPLGPLSAQEPKLRASLQVIPRPEHVGVNALAYRPDGKALAIAASMNTMTIWDTATLKSTATMFNTDPVSSLGVSFWSVAFSSDGKTVASANGHSLEVPVSPNDTVQLWDTGTGKKIATLEGHTNFVMSVAFSPDGKTVASGSGDRTVRLWDVASRKNTAILKGHSDIPTPFGSLPRGISVTFSPDGKTLASGDNDTNIVKLWDVATGKELATLNGWGPVAFSPDGKTLASGSGRELAPSPDLPSGKKLATGPVLLWDVATRKNIAKLEGHTHLVSCVAFSPDGKTLASGSADNTVRLWNVSTGKSTATLKDHADWVSSVAFSPDGKTLASGSRDGTIKFWDVPPAK